METAELIKPVRIKKEIDYSQAMKYAVIGSKDRFWYKECTDMFVELFGPDELELVCKLFAATSINTSLKANITLFRKAYYQLKNELPFESYLPNIKNQLELIKRGEDLSGRKISNFAKAMAGDPNAVVVDIWLLRAFDQDRKYMRHTGAHAGLERSGGASPRQYNLIEDYIKQHAKEMGLQPREFCAMIWSGVRIAHTGDQTTRYCDILRAKLTNLFGVI